MDWRDEGILLWVRRHGENNAIVEALTVEHGRHAGLVRGGASKSQASMMQPGAQLSLEWSARLEDHLGTYKVDLVRSRAGSILTNRDALATLNVISTLLTRLLPEREPNRPLYELTLALLDAFVAGDPYWPIKYANWEMSLLECLGFGLDLTSCAATGVRDDLVYVSPRSGRAVCRSAGAPFADRMLPLPQFLIGRGKASMGDVREALRLSGFFLKNRACAAADVKDLPQARIRLMRLMESVEMSEPEEEVPEFTDEEEEWLRQQGFGAEQSQIEDNSDPKSLVN